MASPNFNKFFACLQRSDAVLVNIMAGRVDNRLKYLSDTMRHIAKNAQFSIVNKQRKIDDEIDEIEYRVFEENEKFNSQRVSKHSTQNRQNLGRIKYQVFTGKKEEWRGWWAAFKSGFHTNADILLVFGSVKHNREELRELLDKLDLHTRAHLV